MRHTGKRVLRRCALVLSGFLALAAGVAWLAMQPGPRSSRSFDKGRNGIWIGHQWYTGYRVRTGEPLTAPEFACKPVCSRAWRATSTATAC